MHVPLVRRVPGSGAATAAQSGVPGEPSALRRARWLAGLMDERWRVGPLRFGLETLTDLVPVVGDVVSLGVSAYQLGIARTLGVPRRQRLRMALNIGLDVALGAIPVLGDLADTAFKVHLRNQRLLEAAVTGEARPT